MSKSGQFNAKEAGVVFEHADIDGDGKDRNIQESRFLLIDWFIFKFTIDRFIS